MTVAVARSLPVASVVAQWPRHLAALAIAWAGVWLLFRRDVADLAHLWWTSTTYGHCLFVLPVAFWLAWTRRGELALLSPVAWPPGLALVAAGGALWLIGEAAGVALARQVGWLATMEAGVVTLLGPSVARGLLFPLGYAFFAVPFGDQLEPPLQAITVALAMPLLHLSGIPASVDGVLIHAGQHYFEVAEACSGSKFVLAMLAFGALVANTCFVSWGRRAAFMAACVVVPVLANGVRAFGTIYAAELTSVETATGIDHVVYGWLFFAAVMALLIAGAWRWFDRSPDAPAFDPAALPPPRTTMEAFAALPLMLALAAFFPLWSSLQFARPAPLPAAIALPDIAGWHRVPLSRRAPWSPHYPGADHVLLGRYEDARGVRVDMAVAVYASQREGAELVGFGIGALREADRWIRVADLPAVAGGRTMRIVAPTPRGSVERVVATWYRLNAMTTASDSRVKWETARMRIAGPPSPASAILLSAEQRPGHDAAAAIRRFVADAGPVGLLADRLVAAPAG